MGFLKAAAFLLLAACVSADSTYVVMAPKIIRPGLTANIQYNLRNAGGSVNIVLEIVQNGQVKKTSSHPNIAAGRVFTSRLDIPTTLTAGTATIRVTVTGSISHTSSSSVTVEAKSLSIFIQTDKAMYKPSQTVNFRAVVVDPRMLPYRGNCSIDIKDAQGNKIKQWTSIQLESGILTEKLELSDQPVLGDWKIKVTSDKGESQEKKFTIDKYVLPKFEVLVDAPAFMLTSDSQIRATVNSKYTYGKGVDGTAVVTISNPSLTYWGYDSVARQNLAARTIELRDLALVDGKVEVTLTSNQLKTITSNYRGLQNGNKFTISANVTETLTGITRTGESIVKVYTSAEKLEFLSSSPSSFKPGLSYTGFLKLSQVDGGVVSNPRSGNIRVGYTVATTRDPVPTNIRWGGIIGPQTTTTYVNVAVIFPQNGLAKFSLDVPAGTTSITLNAKYDNKNSVQASKTVKETKSPSKSFVQLVLLSTQLRAGSQANFRMSSTKPGQTVDYQIWARGSMVSSGSVQVNSQSTFSLQVTAGMAPSARIIAYYVLSDSSKELVADSLNFNVEGAFDANQVAVTYSKQRAQPGESVDVQVSAVTGSIVGLLAVDQSVLLLAGGNDITQADVLSELRSYDSISKTSSQPSFRFFWYPYSVSGTDTSTILSNSGLVALTNALVYKHVEKNFPIRPMFAWDALNRGGFAMAGAFGGRNKVLDGISSIGDSLESISKVPSNSKASSSSGEEVVVRKAFPESWLWSNMTAVNGRVIISTTVPDTITSWVASAFAVSSHAGLGVSSETAKMQVFKPFFVSLNLPYSVVRGEQLVLQAIVFNYMERDVNVTVTLPASDEYRSIVVSAAGDTSNVKQAETITVTARANAGTTVSFPIIPAAIGSMRVRVTAVTAGAADAVERTLLVEAEGVEQEYNQAVMIDLKNTSSFSQTMTIDFPPNIVSDSARVEFSVIGDIMGPSINGLDKLIKMPYGCGEQNMLNFAPTIFVTEYLTQTSQLSGELKSKSIGFMEKGYQRELTYQRDDGSFSAFGQRDPSGSMWLTAFVAKSFQKARAFIFVDEETILRAVNWMITRQNSDGSFPEPGRIIHKEMLGGGASSTVTLTAFVLTAISEVQLRSTEIAPRLATAKTNAQRYLESRASTLSDPYSLALTSYALFKSGSNNVDITLAPLERLARNEGGSQYWEQPQAAPATNSRAWRPPHKQGKAINIELAAYVLQLKIERSGVTSAFSILRWLSTQRNSNGGFSSTQDTVVALQALAMFAKIADGNSNMGVSVTASGETYNYTITSANSLVLQSRVLNESVRVVQIDATGSGIALAQVSATYNVEDYEQEPAFHTTAVVQNENENTITVRVCTRWLLNGTTGMAVKEIGIPSGFSADIEDLESKNYAGVKRVEEGDRKVILYFDELGATERCVEVNALRTGLVAKAKPVAVKVYDYYEPENQQTIFYSSTCLDNVNICDVCGANCEGCTAYFKRR